MFSSGFHEDDPMNMYSSPILRRQGLGGPRQVFDEYYRCYPVAMLPGPDRVSANHGGKVFLPPSALDRLTRLHITYPMLFELTNGAKERTTHAGVLEFIAEEGKIYLPYWIMQTLLLEPGDLIQIKSTDLPPGSFIKVQPQSTAFLDISDPKAVLENVMRNFSCLTKGDIFSFEYNDQVYEMAVLETRPENSKNSISVLETDLEVDFAPPVGYQEPTKESGLSTPRSGLVGAGALPHGGTIHNQGTMAQAINYPSIAPNSTQATAGGKAVSSNFLSAGQKLSRKGASRNVTPNPSTPVPGAASQPTLPIKKTNGPQPLRLPPGKLFFGYEIKPLRNKSSESETQPEQSFQGMGQSLRGGIKRKGDGGNAAAKDEPKGSSEQPDKRTGRTLRDFK